MRIVFLTTLLAAPLVLCGQAGNSGKQDNNPFSDPFIARARSTMESVLNALGGYTATEYTTQYIKSPTGGRDDGWLTIANVTTDVSLKGEAEAYSNTLVNGTPARVNFFGKPGLALAVSNAGGLWSTGDFATLVRDLFSSPTRTAFREIGPAKMAEMAVIRYGFSVEQSHSPWRIDAGTETWQPAFSGTAWLSPTRTRAMRVEMKAEALPAEFPLQTAEMAVDFGEIFVDEQRVFLPVYSQALVCQRGTGTCLRNETEFREYRKSGAN